MERRLAAILEVDMVGYGRLMAADEAGTLARQQAHLAELFKPRIAEYGGRIVKTTGDGLLGEFPSIVDALRCAVNIQLAMSERETGVPPDQRIVLTIRPPNPRLVAKALPPFRSLRRRERSRTRPDRTTPPPTVADGLCPRTP